MSDTTAQPPSSGSRQQPGQPSLQAAPALRRRLGRRPAPRRRRRGRWWRCRRRARHAVPPGPSRPRTRSPCSGPSRRRSSRLTTTSPCSSSSIGTRCTHRPGRRPRRARAGRRQRRSRPARSRWTCRSAYFRPSAASELHAEADRRGRGRAFGDRRGRRRRRRCRPGRPCLRSAGCRSRAAGGPSEQGKAEACASRRPCGNTGRRATGVHASPAAARRTGPAPRHQHGAVHLLHRLAMLVQRRGVQVTPGRCSGGSGCRAGADLDDDVQRVAGPHRAAPGQLLDLGAHAAAGEAAEQGLDLQPHGHAAGMPAAGDQGRRTGCRRAASSLVCCGCGSNSAAKARCGRASIGAGRGGEAAVRRGGLRNRAGHGRSPNACRFHVAEPGPRRRRRSALTAPSASSPAPSARNTGASEPVQRRASQPPPTAISGAQHGGEQRPGHPPGALGREVERHAEAEEAVERPGDAQIGAAGLEHGGVGAEQAEPGVAARPRPASADRLGHGEGEPRRRSRRPATPARAGRRRYWCRPARPAARRGRTPAAPAGIPAATRRRSRRSRRCRSGRHRRWRRVTTMLRLQRDQRGDQADPQDVPQRRAAAAAPGAAAPASGRTSRYQASTRAARRRSRAASPPRRRRRRAPGTGRRRRSGKATAGSARTAPPQMTSAGTTMLPVPRMQLASAFNSQSSMAPPNTTSE